MNKLWYALNSKYYAKAPSHILERGKGVEEIASSFLLFKKKKEGKFWKFLDVYALELKSESSLMLKWSCLRQMLLEMLWFTLFAWGFLFGKAFVWERGKICGEWFIAPKLCFSFNFMKFICYLRGKKVLKLTWALKFGKLKLK